MKYYIGLVFACLIACLIPIFCQLFSIKDLWYESYAAIIGVVLTAIITFFLFKGQTSSEVKREKEAKVYEEKLQIYKEFLNCLCDIIQDGKITEEEKVRLKFQAASISMHTDSVKTKEISEHVCRIIGAVQNGNNKDELLKELFGIVKVFRGVLYSKENEPFVSELDIENTISAFSSIDDDTEVLDSKDKTAEIKTELKPQYVPFYQAIIGKISTMNLGVDLNIIDNRMLMITSSKLGSTEKIGNVAKDCLIFVPANDSFILQTWQRSIINTSIRRNLYVKLGDEAKQDSSLDLKSTFSTAYCQTTYPTDKYRYLTPRTMNNGVELKGSIDLIQALDNDMIEYCVKLVQLTFNNVIKLRQELI